MARPKANSKVEDKVEESVLSPMVKEAYTGSAHKSYVATEDIYMTTDQRQAVRKDHPHSGECIATEGDIVCGATVNLFDLLNPEPRD